MVEQVEPGQQKRYYEEPLTEALSLPEGKQWQDPAVGQFVANLKTNLFEEVMAFYGSSPDIGEELVKKLLK